MEALATDKQIQIEDTVHLEFPGIIYPTRGYATVKVESYDAVSGEYIGAVVRSWGCRFFEVGSLLKFKKEHTFELS